MLMHQSTTLRSAKHLLCEVLNYYICDVVEPIPSTVLREEDFVEWLDELLQHQAVDVFENLRFGSDADGFNVSWWDPWTIGSSVTLTIKSSSQEKTWEVDFYYEGEEPPFLTRL